MIYEFIARAHSQVMVRVTPTGFRRRNPKIPSSKFITLEQLRHVKLFKFLPLQRLLCCGLTRV